MARRVFMMNATRPFFERHLRDFSLQERENIEVRSRCVASALIWEDMLAARVVGVRFRSLNR